jgi:hypothetical protein
MSSGSCFTSKLYDKIIKMLSKSHETIFLIRPFVYRLLTGNIHVNKHYRYVNIVN